MAQQLTPTKRKKLFGIIPVFWKKSAVIIPVVSLTGTIVADGKNNRININSSGPLLEKAFAIKGAPAVAISINSPGGSPVQSSLVAKRIKQLAQKHKKEVLIFVQDVAASGGYWIAAVGDEIYADRASIVGSIGVISGGFGFEEAIEKIGVKRRIYTAGKNKSTLDPFIAPKKGELDRMKAILAEMHTVFIDHIKAHRGDKITVSDDALFTGEYWMADKGIELGLVDGIGDLHSVLKEKYGDKVQLKPVKKPRGMLAMPSLPFGSQIDENLGASIADGLISAAEDRALWARYGL